MDGKSTENYGQNHGQMISEIREWLVRIDTHQQHQTKLLEDLTKQASNAFAKADNAEVVANKALDEARKTRKDFEEYKKDQVVGKRWAIGLAVSLFLTLLPILANFYLN